MQNKLPTIKSLFFRVLFISAIVQIILLVALTISGQNFYKSNKLDMLKKDLLVVNNALINEIARYSILNNNYAIDLSLMELQQKAKLDSVKLVKSLNGLAFQDCNLSPHSQTICSDNKDSFVGIIPLIIDNESFGFIITKNTYPSGFFDTSIQLITILCAALIATMIILNYFLILLSIKRYVGIDMNNLIKVVSGSDPTIFNTKDFQIVSDYVIQKREQVAQLQKVISEKRFQEKMYLISMNMAHDLNNPLNGLRMIIPKLKGQLTNSNELKLLETYANQIQAISSDVLSYFRTSTAESHNSTNNTTATRFVLVEELINNILEQNNNWQCEIQFFHEKYSWIKLIPIQLERMLNNLLNNAYESLNKSIKNITIKTSQQNNQIILTIEDNGCGIPQQHIPEILSGKSLKHSGKGLGLSSALEYLNSIGGSLNIESQVDVGTKLTITIPQNVPNWFSPTIQYNSKSIFIVFENNISVINQLQKMLLEIDNQKLYFSDHAAFTEYLDKFTEPKTNLILLLGDTCYQQLGDFLSSSSLAMTYIIYTENIDYESIITMEHTNCYKLIPKSLLGEISLKFNQK